MSTVVVAVLTLGDRVRFCILLHERRSSMTGTLGVPYHIFCILHLFFLLLQRGRGNQALTLDGSELGSSVRDKETHDDGRKNYDEEVCVKSGAQPWPRLAATRLFNVMARGRESAGDFFPALHY